MLQYIQCLKAKDGLTIQEFRQAFAAYREKVVALGDALGATRVETSTTLAVQANLQVMTNRGTSPPFDGVVEIYFERAAGLEEALARPDLAERVAAMQAHQESFVNLGRSTFFFASVEAG